MKTRNPLVICLKLLLIIVFILMGLFTKVYSNLCSSFVVNYFGGAIYVVVFILITSLAFPHLKPVKISLVVLALTCFIEFSQLIHISKIDFLREFFIFRTLIGTTYNPIDFLAYFIGAFLGLGTVLFINKASNYNH